MEDINKKEFDKNSLSNEILDEEMNCTHIESSNGATGNVEIINEYCSTNEIGVHKHTDDVELAMQECKFKNDIGSSGDFQVNGITKQANNNEDVDINFPNESSKTNCIDLKTPSPESHGGCFNNHDLPTSMQCSLKIPRVNPVSNEFDLIEDANFSAQNTNLMSNNPKELTYNSDNSLVISNSNAVPLVESLVSNNCSLAQLATYDSDESSHEEAPITSQSYRESKSKIQESDDSDSDSSSSSSSTSILISDTSDSESCADYEECTPDIPKPVKAKGELDLDDLPPIEDLKISVPEDECILIGKVFQIVDKLVVIQAMRDKPAYDLDTVLFVEGGQPLGRIFDVFGPVVEPFYCVRFNSNDHIKEKNITLNQSVFSAPKTKYTKYVFLAQLMKIKGSDASWKNDEEPPEIHLDYSDDEQEQKAKKKKSRNKKAVLKVDLDPDEPARKKHFAYERKMNERNLEFSAIGNRQNIPKSGYNPWASNKPPVGPSTSNISKYPSYQNECHQMFGNPPIFNARIPPPPPFSLARPNMLPIQPSNRNPSTNCVQPAVHSRRFTNPSNSHILPPNRSAASHSSNEVPHYSLSPLPLPQQTPFGNQSQLSLWNQLHSNNNNVWPYSPSPPVPSMGSPILSRNRLPSSPFWIQRPPLPPSPLIQRPVHGMGNRLYDPPRGWCVPPLRNNLPSQDRLPPNFNPYAPPPSPHNARH